MHIPPKRVHRFGGICKNPQVRTLADELGIGYVPVYETMEQFLRTQQRQSDVAFDEPRAGTMMMRAVWDHNIRGRSWDDVSARNGLLLQTDTIHFNGHGADIIADLIESWLQKRVLLQKV